MIPSPDIRTAQHPGMACTGLQAENVAFITSRTQICKKDFNMNGDQPDQLQWQMK
jgi:hypothetical protein